jgi:glycyl-tRNA synthetase (class II)
VHSKETKAKLVVRQALETPIVSEVWEPNLDGKKAGPLFKGDYKKLEEVICKMSQMELESSKNILEQEGKIEVNVNGKELVLDSALIQIGRVTKKETSTTLLGLTYSSL